MPKTFKKEFRTDGCSVAWKNSYTYDIRYRRNGYDTSSPPFFLFYLENGFIKYTIFFNYFF